MLREIAFKLIIKAWVIYKSFFNIFIVKTFSFGYYDNLQTN